MTLRDQKNPDNQIRWVMSRFPSCTTHKSIYNGDLKLVLTRGIYLDQNIILDLERKI